MKIPKIGDVKRFSFGEMTSNDNGKTSGTSTAGLYIIFIGGLCFLLGCIDKLWITKSIDVITQAITFTLIGATLLGVKNVMNGKKPIATDLVEAPVEEPAPDQPLNS
jgi:hypothetical protein